MTAPLAFTQDFALAQRVVEGDGRAQKQLAQRLIVRVRRAAHALMGGAPEADDAAQHTLIELLRSIRTYPGEASLESWADRLAVRSVVRFARAVRARTPALSAESQSLLDDQRPEWHARTLEEFLRELPSAPREALLLREAFGFDLIETAQLVRSSTRATREQLARARHSVYLRTIKGADATPTLPEAVERWFALRDRGSNAQTRAVSSDDLSPEEQEELRSLEATPELRKLQKELRGLAQFVEGGRFGRLSQRDKKLLEGALAAARVSSVSTSQSLPQDTARESSPELATEHSWVHPLSLGMCVALVVAALVALALRAPSAAVQNGAPSLPVANEQHAPTVEALSSAQAVERGARLSRGGEPLDQGASLRESDVVSARNKAACFGLSPRADVCLAAGSQARIAELGLHRRRVELISGRAVASVERVDPGVPFALSVRELRVETSDAVLGFEIDGDKIVVRVLRGSGLIGTPSETHALAAAQSAIYGADGKLEVVPQLIEKARRDWELLATRTQAQPALREAAGAKAELGLTAVSASDAPDAGGAAMLEEAGSEPDTSSALLAELAPPPPPVPEADPAPTPAPPEQLETPEALLARAKLAERERRFADAASLYQELIRSAPTSRSAREALVLRGEVLSEHLRLPQEALGLFDRYLGSGGGMLEVRARYGRVLALRYLGRAAEERLATQQFLASFGGTPQARVLRARSQTTQTP